MSIEKAIELAKSNISRYKLAAVITDKKGRIISKGLNSYTTTHPKQAHWAIKANKPKSIYLHAEIASIISAKNKGNIMYVVRVDDEGNLKMAKPCDICQLAIKNLTKIKVVYYSIDNKTIGRLEL